VKLSLIIPAYQRISSLLKVLEKVHQCESPPEETLVYVDGGDPAVLSALDTWKGRVRIFSGQTLLGPGGARSFLMQEARHEWVVNLDDDAYPVEADFFLKVRQLIQQFPSVAVWSAVEPALDSSQQMQRVSLYAGYACVFRKEAFVKAGGYVALAFAYCMEEVDLGLRLHQAQAWMVKAPSLRICHEAETRAVTVDFQAKALKNIMLHFFLRYPAWLWPLAGMQLIKRLFWLLKICPQAILPGFKGLWSYLQLWAHLRQPVSARAIFTWLKLQRFPQKVSDDDLRNCLS
jgi:GT2 family glycosyltransferase